MPEGPEVRKYAAALDSVLTNQRITSIEARTKNARAWLDENASRLVGRRVERVVSHGKHLLGYIEGGFYFHSHLMMWGRWQTFSAHRNPIRRNLCQPEEHRRVLRTLRPSNAASLYWKEIDVSEPGSLFAAEQQFCCQRPSLMWARVILIRKSRYFEHSGPMPFPTIAALPQVNLRAGCFFPRTAT